MKRITEPLFRKFVFEKSESRVRTFKEEIRGKTE